MAERLTFEEALLQVEDDLATADAFLRAARGRVEEIRAMRDGIRLAQSRYEGSAPELSSQYPPEVTT